LLTIICFPIYNFFYWKDVIETWKFRHAGKLKGKERRSPSFSIPVFETSRFFTPNNILIFVLYRYFQNLDKPECSNAKKSVDKGTPVQKKKRTLPNPDNDPGLFMSCI
jgi:hypothetical protein